MTKIKLCGLTRECDIEAANKCLPDYIGFVFAEKSSRYVQEEKAEKLKQKLSSKILAVGVFVDASVQKIIEMLDSGIIDAAQLHGKETPEEICMLQKKTGKPIVKAFCVKSENDIMEANASPADIVLLDAKEGGMGIPFDWTLLKHVERPYFLAGGLGLDNIKNVIEEFAPYGVDVSSGIETDGQKDPEKMAAFVAAVRNRRKEEEK